ncbi:MAG: DUF2279 domain-containing protein [Bacteroidales bacterium]
MIKKLPFLRFVSFLLSLFLMPGLPMNARAATEEQQTSFFSFLEPSPQLNMNRVWTVSGAQVVGYGTTLVLLNTLWYQEYPRQGFNFHNDLEDWMQMDKLGHSTTAYHLSRLGASSFVWAGVDERTSTWLGALSATSFMGVVEILDGFSTGWGFSTADFVANKIGAFTYIGQQLAWQEQKILWKFSFSPTSLADQRPELLGSTLPEMMLKDYNGQTYWLSFNLNALSGSEVLPHWLNLAVGHGAYGMLSSRASHSPVPQMERYRQWYIAPDIDWQRIPTNSPFLKTLFTTLNYLKVPAPAIEYNRVEGFQFHLIFF